MSDTAIVYTPRDGTEKTVTLGTAPAVELFAGRPGVLGSSTVSHGGQSVSVIHDVWKRYDVELRGIKPDTSPALHAGLTAFLSEARAGVRFAFVLDDDQDTETTLTGAEAEDQTVLSVGDSTGMSVGDWLTIVDADDATQLQDAKVLTVDSGVQITLNSNTPLMANYVTGSTVRHRDYFPLCLLEGLGDYLERRAGQGAGVWDLRLRFRTVRG